MFWLEGDAAPPAQSAVSELVSNLESQIGVQLFDRTERYPKLTPAGADARTVVGNVAVLKARAKGISGGLEPELRRCGCALSY